MCIDAIACALVKKGNNRVAENQRDEGVGTLGTMFDVDCWVEFESFVEEIFPSFTYVFAAPNCSWSADDDANQGEGIGLLIRTYNEVNHLAADVDPHGDPNKCQGVWVGDVDAADPERTAHGHERDVPNHDIPHHWDQEGDEDEVASLNSLLAEQCHGPNS